MTPRLLEVIDLRVRLRRGGGVADVVDGVSLSLDAAETLGVVGESGCGKSLLALAIIGLLPPVAVASGRVLLDGTDLLALDERALCGVRGRRIGMVFQEPMLALDPRVAIGRQVAEGLTTHLRLGRGEVEARVRALLDRVGLPASLVSPHAYPHQLSGGQRQRVLIAAALACGPQLLIADEFSTALDMTTQAQILDLLRDITRERDLALMLISHDLGLVRQVADRVLVLYAGRVAEIGAADAVLGGGAHPYTRGLLASTLHATRHAPGQPIPTIRGQVPDAFERPACCAFVPRCDRALPSCSLQLPPLAGPPDHLAACLNPAGAA